MLIHFELTHKGSKEVIAVSPTITCGEVCELIAKKFNLVLSSVKIVGLSVGKFPSADTVLSSLPKVQKSMSSDASIVMKLMVLGVVADELAELRTREDKYIAQRDASEHQSLLQQLRRERAQLTPLRVQVERQVRLSGLLQRLEQAWESDRRVDGGHVVALAAETEDEDAYTGHVPPVRTGGAEEALLPALRAAGAHAWAAGRAIELRLDAQEQHLLRGGTAREAMAVSPGTVSTAEAEREGGTVALSVWVEEKRRRLHAEAMERKAAREEARAAEIERARVSDFLRYGAVRVMGHRVWCRLRVCVNAADTGVNGGGDSSGSGRTTDGASSNAYRENKQEPSVLSPRARVAAAASTGTAPSVGNGVRVPSRVLAAATAGDVSFPLVLAVHSVESLHDAGVHSDSSTSQRLDATAQPGNAQRVASVHIAVGRVLEVAGFDEDSVDCHSPVTYQQYNAQHAGAAWASAEAGSEVTVTPLALLSIPPARAAALGLCTGDVVTLHSVPVGHALVQQYPAPQHYIPPWHAPRSPDGVDAWVARHYRQPITAWLPHAQRLSLAPVARTAWALLDARARRECMETALGMVRIAERADVLVAHTCYGAIPFLVVDTAPLPGDHTLPNVSPPHSDVSTASAAVTQRDSGEGWGAVWLGGHAEAAVTVVEPAAGPSSLYSGGSLYEEMETLWKTVWRHCHGVDAANPSSLACVVATHAAAHHLPVAAWGEAVLCAPPGSEGKSVNTTVDCNTAATTHTAAATSAPVAVADASSLAWDLALARASAQALGATAASASPWSSAGALPPAGDGVDTRASPKGEGVGSAVFPLVRVLAAEQAWAAGTASSPTLAATVTTAAANKLSALSTGTPAGAGMDAVASLSAHLYAGRMADGAWEIRALLNSATHIHSHYTSSPHSPSSSLFSSSPSPPCPSLASPLTQLACSGNPFPLHASSTRYALRLPIPRTVRGERVRVVLALEHARVVAALPDPIQPAVSSPASSSSSSSAASAAVPLPVPGEPCIDIFALARTAGPASLWRHTIACFAGEGERGAVDVDVDGAEEGEARGVWLSVGVCGHRCVGEVTLLMRITEVSNYEHAATQSAALAEPPELHIDNQAQRATAAQSPSSPASATGAATHTPAAARCRHCGVEVPPAQLALHELRCVRLSARCPHCSMTLPSRQLPRHLALVHAALQCACGLTLQLKHVPAHAALVCPLRLRPCTWCPLSFPAEALRAHELACGVRSGRCVMCNVEQPRRAMRYHMSSVHAVPLDMVNKQMWI